MRVPWGRRLCSLSVALCFVSACGVDDAREGLDGSTTEPPQFTVRARWADATTISYRIDAAGAAVAALGFRSAIEQAIEVWVDAGSIDLTEARPEEEADVSFSWRRGAHDSCEPFGISTARAHTGPLTQSTFVHFDAGRSWNAEEVGDDALFFDALHEMGHVLGLGHSPAPGALMRPDARGGPMGLTASELAGLHSLYGGGQDDPSDLVIFDGEDAEREGAVAAILRGVAPVGITEVGVIDSDGDGDTEVLVWRTDAAGNGALMIYHFGPGPGLTHTVGPLYGMGAPGVPNLFVTTDGGERLMVCVYDQGKLLVRRFDERGLLVPRPEGMPLMVEGGIQDADGDGFLDEPLHLEAVPARRWVGDLDGDQGGDVVVRR